MFKFKFSAIAMLLTFMPMAPAQSPVWAGAQQDDCPIVRHPDGTESADCSSTAVGAVAPVVIVPQCTAFPYRVLPAYSPAQCAVTSSYIAVDRYPVYILTCCS